MVFSIDVVVPTYQRRDLTERCLAFLAAQTLPHTVIVVDNGSTDGTPQHVRASFPEVRVMELGANLGFPLACNRGAAAGDGDAIVLLNNDVECRPDFLEQIVAPLLEDARVGSVASLLVRPDGRTIDSLGMTVDPTLAGFPRLRGRPVGDASAERRPVLAGPSGGGGAYRRAAWNEVGGLDEGVLFYGEDVDLALRLQSAGWQTVAVPEAVAVHLGSASAGHRSSWQRYQGGFARGYFLRRYAVLESRAATRALVTEGLVVAGDAVISRDFSALRGRITGWHAAAGAPRRPLPPPEAIDAGIGFWESLRLRRVVYGT